MSKKLEFVVFLIIIVLFVGWGEYIIPTKLEISDIQVVQVMGMDSDENEKVSLSLLFEPHKGEDEKGKEEERILTVSSDSFVGAEQGIQYYENKIFIGSHVKDIVIGEKLAEEDLVRVMDFIGKNGELRLDSKIYIAKESKASSIFKDGVGNGYLLSDRIDNLCLTKERGKEKRCVKVLDVVKLLLSDDKIGVIPCVKLIDNGGKDLDEEVISALEKEEKILELSGYGVIKYGKLIGYLGNIESNGYDYIKNSIVEEDIKVVDRDKIIGLKVINSNTNIKYDFSGDTLNKVIIKINTNSSLLENSSGGNVFASGIKTIEELENNYIKDVVKTTIKYAQNINTDFLGIGDSMELKHPYKWRKIKDEWSKMFSTIPIEVEVNSKIDEEYGILSTTNKS